MRVVYFCYRKWSFDILNLLLKENSPSWNIAATVIPHGSKEKPAKKSIPLIYEDPNKLNDKKFLKSLERLQPQVLLFFGWSWMIPKEIHKKYLCLVLHPSPLPKYRGGSPIQNQIIANETKSAVTIFQVKEKIDAGKIYAQEFFSLKGSLGSILRRIVKIGAKQAIFVLDSIANKTIKPLKQDEKQATLFKRRKPIQSELTIEDFKTKSARYLYNFIRSLEDPYPNAFIVCNDGKKLFLTGARIEDEKK